MTKKPKPEEVQRPARPYDDVPLLGKEPPRCTRCNCALYGNVVQSPVCPFCQHKQDVIEHEAAMVEHARTMAALNKRHDTPTEASFRQGWRDMLRGNTRPVAELWDDIETPAPEPTPIDGSDHEDTSASQRDFERRIYQDAAREDAKDGDPIDFTDMDYDALTREMWGPFEDGEGDTPEVEYIPIDDDTPQEWVEDVDYGEDVA